MNNSTPDFLKLIREIPYRKLREITYLMGSQNIEHSQIPIQLKFQPFADRKKGIKDLLIEKMSKRDSIAKLNAIDHRSALGRYAERLVAVWFKLNPHYELLTHNLQLVIAKRTVGEIDFLIEEEKSKRAIHLEFALKFYLQTEDSPSPRFIGPKGRDSLNGKVEKLLDHQMRLSEVYKEQLPENLRNYDFRPRIMIKGVLFYPFKKGDSRDLWLRISDRDALSSMPENLEFTLLKHRRSWIFPFDPDLDSKRVGKHSLIDQLGKKDLSLPLMVAYSDHKQIYGRIMMVEDSWPERS